MSRTAIGFFAPILTMALLWSMSPIRQAEA